MHPIFESKYYLGSAYYLNTIFESEHLFRMRTEYFHQAGVYLHYQAHGGNSRYIFTDGPKAPKQVRDGVAKSRRYSITPVYNPVCAAPWPAAALSCTVTVLVTGTACATDTARVPCRHSLRHLCFVSRCLSRIPHCTLQQPAAHPPIERLASLAYCMTPFDNTPSMYRALRLSRMLYGTSRPKPPHPYTPLQALSHPYSMLETPGPKPPLRKCPARPECLQNYCRRRVWCVWFRGCCRSQSRAPRDAASTQTHPVCEVGMVWSQSSVRVVMIG